MNAYRDDLEAAHQRAATLAREVEELREQNAQLAQRLAIAPAIANVEIKETTPARKRRGNAAYLGVAVVIIGSCIGGLAAALGTLILVGVMGMAMSGGREDS